MQENKTFQTRSRDFLKKQGFYIVLFVCLLIVGTAIALTAIPRANTPQDAGTAGEPVVESNVSDDEKLTARNTPLPTATPAPTALPTATPAPTNTPKPAVKTVKKAAAPLSGDICWGYAIDQLRTARRLTSGRRTPASTSRPGSARPSRPCSPAPCAPSPATTRSARS